MDAEERAAHILRECCYGPTRNELITEQIRQAERAAREELYIEFIELALLAWPERGKLVYSDNPFEAITDLIEERDAAREIVLEEVYGAVCDICWRDSDKSSEAVRWSEDYQEFVHGDPNVLYRPCKANAIRALKDKP